MSAEGTKRSVETGVSENEERLQEVFNQAGNRADRPRRGMA